MEKVQAEYIQQIEIYSMWGLKHIVWKLRPDVNILSGVTGIGKSTILNTSVSSLSEMNGELPMPQHPAVHLTFYPENATSIRYDVIRSFDRPLIHFELLEKMIDRKVHTELDWQLYNLQRRYLDYQVNIGNKMIDMLSSDDPAEQAKASSLSVPKRMFQDMIDELFKDTRKKINRKTNEITFLYGKELISPYKLSSGEKQILVILLTVLIQDQQRCVLFMDEPEVSLHVEWQQQLISLIRKLNPNVQIILTTHSPAVIMNGWIDAVTEVSDITQDI